MEFFHLQAAEFAFCPAFQLNRSTKKVERRQESLQVFRGHSARRQGTLYRSELERGDVINFERIHGRDFRREFDARAGRHNEKVLNFRYRGAMAEIAGKMCEGKALARSH